MRSARPVYLNLLKIRQPLPAVVSILHRASGAALFLALPVVLYLFQASLSDAHGFDALAGHFAVRIALFFVLALYGYHFLAGLRFLLFDLHRPGLYRHLRVSASLVLAGAMLIALLLGAWLW
jgi:succinate dehydrogenase / fumarate reductase cytochrome b subunit